MPGGGEREDSHRKRVAAGAIFLNERGEVLIVKPTYKEQWSLPGGVVDENESPRAACIRECREELGLDVSSVEFAGVDYLSDWHGESLQFKFFGGPLTPEQQAAIRLAPGELSQWSFVPVERLRDFLSPHQAASTPRCIEAARAKAPVYLEDSEPPG